MKKPAGGGMASPPPSPPSCKAGSGSPRLLHSCSGGSEWSVVIRRNVKSSLLLLLVLSTFFVFSSLHSSRSFEPEPAAAGGEALAPSQSTVPGDDDRGNEEEIAVAEKSALADISLPSANSSAAAVPTPNEAEQTGGAGANMDGKCDVSMGKWVRDPTGPVYTYLTCPTLSDYKNCQKYGKDDSHLYWRWQPDGCDLPRFSPEKFLATVRGKSLAFIGDSLARNQMDSLLCLLSQARSTLRNIYCANLPWLQ
uniref:Uncharacterized protein n=1 Tax=Leersia perrieri TaxID=77586 RepID=A0A0D9WNP2_9ORYZ